MQNVTPAAIAVLVLELLVLEAALGALELLAACGASIMGVNP